MIKIKDIKDCPFQMGYERVLIGSRTSDTYDFYADDIWKKKAEDSLNALLKFKNKMREEDGREPVTEIIGLPFCFQYMSQLTIIDGEITKDVHEWLDNERLIGMPQNTVDAFTEGYKWANEHPSDETIIKIINLYNRFGCDKIDENNNVISVETIKSKFHDN